MVVIKLRSGEEIAAEEYHIDVSAKAVRAKCDGQKLTIPFEAIAMLTCGPSRMYEGVKTWSPYWGCRFRCVYCEQSFQRQAKRRKRWCELCYRYEPHFHPERLKKVPSAETIFCCAFGDVAFARLEWVEQILETIRKHDDKTFYIQSKDPSCFLEWERRFELPDNLVLGTTIESDMVRWIDVKRRYYVEYFEISKAPYPSVRASSMRMLNHPRKYVTIEPILWFSVWAFKEIDLTVIPLVLWIEKIKPEFVYVGYDNHSTRLPEPNNVRLPEPSLERTLLLMGELEKITEVRLKTVRRSWWEG